MADGTDILKVQVDFPAGAPRRVVIGRRCLAVVAVLDQWPGSDHCYFKVKADDGATYILRQDTRAQTWQLVLFDSRGRI